MCVLKWNFEMKALEAGRLGIGSRIAALVGELELARRQNSVGIIENKASIVSAPVLSIVL